MPGLETQAETAPDAASKPPNMQIITKKVTELIPYARNSRTHSDAQIAQIAASIKEFGWTNPILVDGSNGIIAGHGRLLAAQKLGYKEVPTIELADLTEAQKKAYIIADNRLALNAEWDNEMLNIELTELLSEGFALDILGFAQVDLDEIFTPEEEIKEQNPYTQNVNVPTYEPTGEKPSFDELYDDQKAIDLIASIKESKLSEKEKQFLMTAASRHIVFNYEKIANFYAHSSKKCQELMEDSALVIIDFDKAIANGFVRLTEEINEMFDIEEDE
jgi:hypothetical protein